MDNLKLHDLQCKFVTAFYLTEVIRLFFLQASSLMHLEHKFVFMMRFNWQFYLYKSRSEGTFIMKRIVLAHVSLHGMNSIPSLHLSTPYIICSGVAYIWTQW